MGNKIRMVCTAAALAPLALLAACGSSGSSGSSSSPSAAAAASGSASSSTGVSLTETGSTLMFPLFGAWQTAYNTKVTTVTITTAGTGSGTGIADAGTGTVTMGASDAYLSSADMTQYPGLVNIPLTVAALMVNYNLPGIKTPLKLSGTVLAKIYAGKIKTWNDSAIKALNPGVTLPSLKITTLHRADSSGSTFLFTSYLNAQDPADWPAADVNTTVSWPSGPAQDAETGSGGMVTGCQGIKGCIAYIGISYLAKTTAAKLGTASLANKAGKYRAADRQDYRHRAGQLLRQDAGERVPVADQHVGGQGLPDHQLRVRGREEGPVERINGLGAEGLPQVDGHHRQFFNVPGAGRLRAAAVEREDHRREPDRIDQRLILWRPRHRQPSRAGGRARCPPPARRRAPQQPPQRRPDPLDWPRRRGHPAVPAGIPAGHAVRRGRPGDQVQQL